MTRLIAITLLLLLPCTAGAQSDMDRYPPPGSGRMLYIGFPSGVTLEAGQGVTEQTLREKAIKQWAASGEICRVLGHNWHKRTEKKPTDMFSVTSRKCSICGKTETLTERWE